MNSKPQDNIPYAVSWIFSENGTVHHGINMLVAPDECIAVGIVLSTYYREGGTLPLLAVKACPVSEEMARAAVRVYDDIAARNKAEAEKVVQPKFGVVPPTQETAQFAGERLPGNQLTGPDWKPPS